MTDFKIVDLAIIVDNTLIISDVHIGYEEELTKKGVLVPRFQFKDIIDRLQDILSDKKFDAIVVNGDLKHEFGTISDTEWRETLKVLDLLSEHAEKIILIRGNHDTILGPIAKKREIEVVDYYVIGDVFICHGDKIVENDAFSDSKIILIGHDHPAVSIREDVRVEKFKCYLIGSFKGKKLIVMPSFNPIVEGTDVLQEKMLSPFLQKIDDFSVLVVGDTLYEFGKIKELKE